MSPEVLTRNLVVGVLYCLFGYLTIAFTTLSDPPLILVWLPSGVALAAVLIYGPTVVPAVAVGSFVFAVSPYFGEEVTRLLVLNAVTGGLWSAVVDSLKVLIEYWICRRFIGDGIFTSVPKIIRFYSIGVIPTPAIAILVLVGGDYFLGFLQIDHDGTLTSFLMEWFSIVLSDIHGMVIVVPMILAFREKGAFGLSQQRLFEKAAILTCLAGIIYVSLYHLDYFVYLVVPVFFWAALRAGLQGLSVALFSFSMSMAIGTATGVGPFVSASQIAALETLFLLTYTLNFTFVAFSAAWRDVQTHQEHLEQRITNRTRELADARDEAQKANKTKSQFLTAASHDLRQPVQAISLFSTALHTRLDGHEAAHFTSKIQVAIHNLNSMLNGLLDMSRLEDDVIVPQLNEFPVNALLDDISRDYAAMAEQKNLKLKVVSSSAIIRSDHALLERILGNLVANAIRYTENGRILVGCRKSESTVRLEVWDTGRGISKEEIEQIFEPHRRLDHTSENMTDGLGLGLTIARALADLLGVNLSVQSTPARGSMFALEIPKGSASGVKGHMTKVQPHYSEMFNGRTILAVDDDETVLAGMQTILGDWGCSVITARRAEDALQIAIEQNDNLDAIVSDFHLSENDTGIGLVKRINTALGRNVATIFISGDTRSEMRREIKHADYFVLTKPIQPASLRVLLRRVLHPKSSTC